MSKNNSDSEPHIAQKFVWWVTGFSLIVTGIWTVFVYFDSDTISRIRNTTFQEPKYFDKPLDLIPIPNSKMGKQCTENNPPLECLWIR